MDGTHQLKPLSILGVTGSIGQQTLDVAERLDIPVSGIAANRGSDALLAIARSVPLAKVVAASPTHDEIIKLQSELGDRIAFGLDALLDLAATPDTITVNGIVGAAGLAPTVAALDAGNRVALANKESLVAGGPVVVAAATDGDGEIIPVDSEHSALWQCLVGESAPSVRRLVLTASGGPFRGKTKEFLEHVTVEQALAHPTWSMGPRITVDSATLMNKAFEVIEAHYLYAIPYDRIDVTVHPQSVVHSLVEFVDGTVKAELGDPDMRVPIQYARFSETLRQGMAVLNAADEIAVAAFLQGRISFPAIADIVAATLDRIPVVDLHTVSDVNAADAESRRVAAEFVELNVRAG